MPFGATDKPCRVCREPGGKLLAALINGKLAVLRLCSECATAADEKINGTDKRQPERLAHLRVRTWAGEKDQQVVVVGETATCYRIRTPTAAPVRLAGRRPWLHEGGWSWGSLLGRGKKQAPKRPAQNFPDRFCRLVIDILIVM